MKPNEETAPVAGSMNVTTKKVFSLSDEELKDFYLKESVVLFPNRCVPNRSEYELLCMLQTEYKQALAFISRLNSTPWEENLSTLYSVTACYMMQSEYSLPDKKRVNATMAEHVKQVSALTVHRTFLHKLQGIYNTHYNNLSRLVKLCSEHKEQKKEK